MMQQDQIPDQKHWTGKRILILLHWLEIGGAERQALLLAKYLKYELGAVVEVWGFDPPGRVAQMCNELDIPCRQVPTGFEWGTWRLIRDMGRLLLKLRRFRADAIIPYTMHPNVVAAVIWRFAGIEACIWQQRDEGRMRVPRLFEWLAVRLSPAFVSNSSPGMEFLNRVLRAPNRHCSLIRNGVEMPVPKVERSTVRAHLGICDEALCVCMVANLHSYKDHNTLLLAWDLMRKRWPTDSHPIVLLLAGRFDNTQPMLATQAAELGLGTSVRFLGSVEDIPSLLAAVDVAAFSSRYEGCPNGVLEAMAAGLPVVATDIPGTRDALGEGCDDVLAAVGDPLQFASRLVALLENAELRRELGSRNRARIEQEFGVDRMCLETASIISRQWRS